MGSLFYKAEELRVYQKLKGLILKTENQLPESFSTNYKQLDSSKKRPLMQETMLNEATVSKQWFWWWNKTDLKPEKAMLSEAVES